MWLRGNEKDATLKLRRSMAFYLPGSGDGSLITFLSPLVQLVNHSVGHAC